MIRLRAFRGQIGNTDFYLSVATFGEVARMVSYKVNDRDWPAELRQQRPPQHVESAELHGSVSIGERGPLL